MKHFFIKLGRWIKAKYISGVVYVSMLIRCSKDFLRYIILNRKNITDGANIVDKVFNERYWDKMIAEYDEWLLQKFGWTEEEWDQARRWS